MIVHPGVGSPSERFTPSPVSGSMDIDLDRWDEIPSRGATVTVRLGGTEMTVTVKYRRRYPERGFARVWFTDGSSKCSSP